MRRTLLLCATFVAVLSGAACHSRPSSTRGAPRPAAQPLPIAKPRDAVVRAISQRYGASVAIADIDGRRVAVVADDDESESALQLVDLDTRAVVATKRLEGAPGQLVFGQDGTLFVAVRGAAHVQALRFRGPGQLDEVARHATADEPFGVALTPDGATLLVTSVAGARIESFRARDLEPGFSAALARDPRSIAVTPDGARAFVSHATGSVLSVVDLAGAAGSKADARGMSLLATERRRDFGQLHFSKPGPHVRTR